MEHILLFGTSVAGLVQPLSNAEAYNIVSALNFVMVGPTLLKVYRKELKSLIVLRYLYSNNKASWPRWLFASSVSNFSDELALLRVFPSILSGLPFQWRACVGFVCLYQKNKQKR